MTTPAATSLSVSGVSGGRRISALDAVRGVAVAGIVPMNVIAFSMPAAAYVNPRSYGGTGLLETALWFASFVLVEDKFRALFSLLFGAGVAILLERGGKGRLTAHYARMAVLFAIGLVHATLLASNDILRLYAVAGLVLPLAVGLKSRTLFWLAAALIAAQMTAVVWFYREVLAEWWRVRQGLPAAGGLLAQMEYSFGADPRMIEASLRQGQETLSGRIERRMENFVPYTFALMAGLPSSLAAMLVGIGFWKNGLLRGEWEAARAIRLFRRIGLPAMLALAVLGAGAIASGFDAVVTASNALIWSAPFDILLGAGWAALFMGLFMRAGDEGASTRLWAAAGRMALTNYLLTSVIFAALFASWGLGLFGEVQRPVAIALCLLPIAAMLLISRPWLKRFRQGPAEWLWRSAAQGKRLPLRRAS